MWIEQSPEVSFRRRRSDLRYAMTLVEIMVVVAISSVLLGVAISLVVGLQHWDRRFRDHALTGEHLARLSEAIRTDIRNASNVTLSVDTTLVVATHDREIRYELRPEGCLRVVKQLVGATERSELFTFGSAPSWELKRGTPGRRPIIIVSLQRPGAKETDSIVTLLMVYAAMGADLPRTASAEPSGKSQVGEEGAAL
jgi:prepilin-type N-terminal cleavage/methylation domain-containing protein